LQFYPPHDESRVCTKSQQKQDTLSVIDSPSDLSMGELTPQATGTDCKGKE
jgi:hypothetical protein